MSEETVIAGTKTLLTERQQERINATMERTVVDFIQKLPARVNEMLNDAVQKALGIDKRHGSVDIAQGSQVMKLIEAIVQETIARKIPDIKSAAMAKFEHDGPDKFVSAYRDAYRRRFEEKCRTEAERQAQSDAEAAVKSFQTPEAITELVQSIDFSTQYRDVYDDKFNTPYGGILIKAEARRVAFGLSEKHKAVPIEEVADFNRVNTTNMTAVAAVLCQNHSCPLINKCANYCNSTNQIETPDLIKADDVWYCGGLIGQAGPITTQIAVSKQQVVDLFGEDALADVPF